MGLIPGFATSTSKNHTALETDHPFNSELSRLIPLSRLISPTRIEMADLLVQAAEMPCTTRITSPLSLPFGPRAGHEGKLPRKMDCIKKNYR
jgi:hypothetical protein